MTDQGEHVLTPQEQQLYQAMTDGDWDTVDAHLAAIQEDAPGVEELYRAMAHATRP